LDDEQNKKTFQLALNEISNTDDPTHVHCNFVILDFNKSHNNTVISKEVAMDGLAQSIMSKPIIGHYNETDSKNPDDDSFEGHNVYLDEDKHGDLAIKFDTNPIGVFTSEGYIIKVDTDEGKKEVLVADAILWKDRFTEAVELLQEWHTRGININTSCELLYSNFEFKDGVEYIKSPIFFSGHAILNSEERGDQPLVLPAYESSKLVSFNEQQKFNRLVAQAISQKNNIKRSEKMPENFKKVFELSHNDIRSRLYREYDVNLHEDEYSWIEDVYESNFIMNIFGNGSDKYYKYNYTKSDDNVEIDYDSKTEVVEERKWVEMEEVKNLQSQLSEKEDKVKTLEVEKTVLSSEKDKVEKQFDTAYKTITSLNGKVEGLEVYKEKFETEQFEKQLEDKKSLYFAKFSALNAKEKFESDEVQELVSKSVSDDSAITQLNSMLVDLVVAKNEEDDKDEKIFTQHNQKREDLIPDNDDFDSRYA